MVASFGLVGATSAYAQCSQTGTTENCSGNLPGALNFNTSSGINDLEINNVTTGPSQASLQGVGTTSGSGASGTAQYACQITDTGSNPTGASCAINNTVQPPTCTATNGTNQTASCVASQTSPSGTGPSGNSGPSVTVHVVAPTSGSVTIGGASAISPPVAVFGISTGSQGGNGGSATLIGNGGDGGPGVDGGPVTVGFTGQLASGTQGGLLAQTVGGAGGNGGSGGSIGGSGGNGGPGGFGNTATANFGGGSIALTGAGNVGITAISQGGNGGSGAGGGFFVSGGGSGNTAGQAGTAQVNTAPGTSISTTGDNGIGIAAYSVGGAGGSGGGGFGLFYSGGGGGSTGGNAGTAKVTAASNITTSGQAAYGILAQSIGGGGGNAGSASGIVALGSSGQIGGNGSTVNISNFGKITTSGLFSIGIVGQSIGGGGGNGSGAGGLVAIGGSGSAGGNGGSVTIQNTGAVSTSGMQAFGIEAQSIGGGGGNGGGSGGLVSIGASGSGGANSGAAEVDNFGAVATGVIPGATTRPAFSFNP